MESVLTLKVGFNPAALRMTSEELARIADTMEVKPQGDGIPVAVVPVGDVPVSEPVPAVLAPMDGLPGLVPAASVVPVAPPIAPVAPVAVAAGVDVDVIGMPWDGRINARTKSMTADGKWKMKRGVTEAEVAAVKAEITGGNIPDAPIAAAPMVAPMPPAAPIAPVAAVPAVPVAPVAPAADEPCTFPMLIAEITAKTQAGTVTAEAVNDVLAKYGYHSITELCSQPQVQLKSIRNSIRALG